MFSVPGWSLSPALLKKQDENDGEGTSSAASKKRKRKNGEAAEVTSDNLSSLYQQHIEKVKPSKQHKQINEKNNAPSVERADRGAAAADGQAQEKPRATKSQKAEFRKARREAQSRADKEKSLVARNDVRREDVSEKTKKKKQKTAHDANGDDPQVLDNDAIDEETPTLPPSSAKLTPMQAAMRQKLIGARFRHLNQTLYTSPSGDASKLFDNNPTFFEEYHAGFRSQVESWPENPIDTFVREIQDRAKVKGSQGKGKKNGGEAATNNADTSLIPLPTTNGTCKIADLGCGDAALASKVSKLRLNAQVLSYDLSKPNKFVTKADIANLPLQNDSINVAIFCLALMGTNWIDFIEEAWRVLHWKGELWVAEIKSRFGKVQNKRVDHSVGHRQKNKRPSKQDLQKQKDKDSQFDSEQLRHEVDEVPLNREGTDVSGFVEVLRRRGFALQDETSVDLSNKMFVRMRFIKALPPLKGKNVRKDATQGGASFKKKMFIEKDKEELDEPGVLKPCLYKSSLGTILTLHPIRTMQGLVEKGFSVRVLAATLQGVDMRLMQRTNILSLAYLFPTDMPTRSAASARGFPGIVQCQLNVLLRQATGALVRLVSPNFVSDNEFDLEGNLAVNQQETQTYLKLYKMRFNVRELLTKR